MKLLSVDLSFPAWHRKQTGVRGVGIREKRRRGHTQRKVSQKIEVDFTREVGGKLFSIMIYVPSWSPLQS